MQALTEKELSKIRREFGAMLKDMREKMDIPQWEVAEKVGIPNRAEIIRLEAGQVKNIDTYLRVAAFLGLGLDIYKQPAVKNVSKYD